MVTQAQALSQEPELVSATTPTRKKRNPFLDALEHIHYGRMFLITPEKETLEFAGPNPGPVAYMQLKDWDVLDELVARGEVAFGEAYMDGRVESQNLEQLITFALVNGDALESYFHGKPLYAIWVRIKSWFERNSISGSKRNIKAHYDLGNDFYKLWLDSSMTYSSALFEGAEKRTLEQAQQAKYQRILGKLNAQPGQHVLEIGCGWGGFAEAAARQGLKVTALTISRDQADFAQKRLTAAGLSDQVSIEFTDYREVKGTYDHIVSIGMFEHVGEKYWPGYFDVICRCLKPGGKAMVQSITLDDKLFETLSGVTGFIEEYIFPGGMLPSKKRFRQEAEKHGLDCKEMFGFGLDYARTCGEWLQRFDQKQAEVRLMGYDERFIRMWQFYLSCCIASFVSKRTDVMQAELTHKA